VYNRFRWESQKGKYGHKNVDVDMRIMDPRGIGRGIMDGIHLAQGREKWRFRVVMIVNFRLHKVEQPRHWWPLKKIRFHGG
jgi:hypothetical protein